MKKGAKSQLWRQKRFWVYLLFVSALVLAAVIFASLKWNWDWRWTGLNGGYPKITEKNIQINGKTGDAEYPPGKTLWDLLQLLGVLAIPAAVGFGTAWFSKKQAQVSEERSTDNQREAALQTYIDKMSELLLVNYSCESAKQFSHSQQRLNTEAQQIARVRTLTVLPMLDGKRKGVVLQFLQEANLISKGQPLVDLRRADLTRTDLIKAHLSGTNLSHTNLYKSILIRADLRASNLSSSHLEVANLSGADLSNADLSNADLSNADLSGAFITQDQWKKAKSLRGTILPDGTTHP